MMIDLNSLDKTYWEALILALVVIFIWKSNAQETPPYEWINSQWLPRLLWSKEAHQYAAEGYREVCMHKLHYRELILTKQIKINKKKGKPFKMMWWSKENIFLPPKYLQDLKSADESSLSFLHNLSDVKSSHCLVPKYLIKNITHFE